MEAVIEQPQTYTLDDHIPMDLWGKDHWSTLAYAETVMVDSGYFEVGFDPRMRQGRRNYRVMAEQNRNPKRPNRTRHPGMVMDDKYSTPLKNGQVVTGHDDWHCVQDMAAAGLFTRLARTRAHPMTVDEVEPKTKLRLSEMGLKLVAQLREHKINGGNFGSFAPNVAT